MAKKTSKTVAKNGSIHPILKRVSIASIGVAPEYQREEKTALIKKIEADLDERAFEIPTVSQRPDGSRWIINGQQRIAAAKRKGYKSITAKLVMVQSSAEEAEIYSKINGTRTNLTAAEKFVSRLHYKERKAVEILNIVESCGRKLFLKKSKEGGKTAVIYPWIRCITAVESIHRRGADQLMAVLTWQNELWPMQNIVCSETWLLGCDLFLHLYGSLIDQEVCVRQFVTKTSAPSTLQIQSDASDIHAMRVNAGGGRGGQSRARECLCSALVNVYNKHLKAGVLPPIPDRLAQIAWQEVQRKKKGNEDALSDTPTE